ncbi:MAG: amidohydrolase family protein [Acidimicrobiia bacterium]
MSEDLIYVRERKLPFKTFDADNHMYETPEALTKFVPPQYDGVIKYVDIKGRTKLAINDKITDYIPNPTFSRVAVPGGFGEDVTKGGDGIHRTAGSIDGGKKVRAMPSIDAFFSPEPRLALMKDMGIDRTVNWPTLPSALEERLADNPDAVVAVVHAFNQWMHEHWTFNYGEAIFCTPIISLAAGVDTAIKELEWVAERGAKVFLIRVAPVPTWKGRKSFALPEFDPFWERVQELGLVVGWHTGDPGYSRYLNEWEGTGNAENRAFAQTVNPVFRMLSSEKDNLVDALASIIGHGLALRYPNLKFFPVEFRWSWVRPFVEKLQRTYEESPALFDEDPFETFKRSVYIHLFHDPRPWELIEMGIGADHLMWGSDFPHPEGMEDPLRYVELLDRLPADQQALLMGGSVARMLGLPE